MASVFIPVPSFPNVPKLPGVPQLARQIGGLVSLSLIQASLQPPAPPGLLWHAAQAAPVWGIFDSSGALAITADSVLVYSYRKEYSISDYPVQDDAFASFNKVAHPREQILRLIKTATLSDRTTFENECEEVADSIELFTIMTPEKTYTNVNVLRHEVQRREQRGAYIIEADLFFREIRIVQGQYNTAGTPVSSTVNAVQPSAVPPVSLGIVQPQPPTVPALSTLSTITADLNNVTVNP